MAVDLGLDEGGDNDDKLLVSVQVGITEPAKRLKRKWKARLRDANNLEYFHSKDFGNRTGGIFSNAGLDEDDRGLLLKDLAGLIHTHLLFGATTRVKVSEYNRLTTQDFRSQIGTAYSFAIDMCLCTAYAIVTEMGLKPEFNILIERGHRNSEQAAQIIADLQKIPQAMIDANPDKLINMKILTGGLGDKKDHPILQSADMVAYSDWQGLSDGDPAIWNALHRPGVRYKTYNLHASEELIKEFVSEGPNPFIRKQRKRAKAYVAEQGVPKFRPDDAETDERTAQRDQSQTGRGEGGEKEKAED
jgi:hypothetical protein